MSLICHCKLVNVLQNTTIRVDFIIANVLEMQQDEEANPLKWDI